MASEVYSELLPLIEQTDDIYDSIEQIYLAEPKASKRCPALGSMIRPNEPNL